MCRQGLDVMPVFTVTQGLVGMDWPQDSASKCPVATAVLPFSIFKNIFFD